LAQVGWFLADGASIFHLPSDISHRAISHQP
jgi:hypothetical protein